MDKFIEVDSFQGESGGGDRYCFSVEQVASVCDAREAGTEIRLKIGTIIYACEPYKEIIKKIGIEGVAKNEQ